MIEFKIKWSNIKPKEQLNKTIEFLGTIDWQEYEREIYTISGPTWEQDDSAYIHILTENRKDYQKWAEKLLSKLKENEESKIVWVLGCDESSELLLNNMLDAPYNEDSENFNKYWMVSFRN